jgi:hypothetical protein
VIGVQMSQYHYIDGLRGQVNFRKLPYQARWFFNPIDSFLPFAQDIAHTCISQDVLVLGFYHQKVQIQRDPVFFIRGSQFLPDDFGNYTEHGSAVDFEAVFDDGEYFEISQFHTCFLLRLLECQASGRAEKAGFGVQKLAFAVFLKFRFACIPIT